jgi:hypothetical protein
MPASPELREDIGHASWGRSLGLATPQFRESVKKKGAPGGGGSHPEKVASLPGRGCVTRGLPQAEARFLALAGHWALVRPRVIRNVVR